VEIKSGAGEKERVSFSLLQRGKQKLIDNKKLIKLEKLIISVAEKLQL